MKNTRIPFIRPSLHGLVLALAVFGLSSQVVRANPYASMITNINYAGREMQFWLNESGATVTIQYSDSTTDPNYNGVTSGVNLPSGVYTFNVPSDASSYTITVYKVGAGQPTLIQTSAAFTPRGVDVNKNPTSPNFGRVYVAYSNGSGIGSFNPDMSEAYEGAASPGGGCVWFGGGFSPYRVFVAADDYLMVGDASIDYSTTVTGALQNDGVWRIDPNLQTAQLFLGPRGAANGISEGVHSTIQSRPVVIGNPSLGGPVTLVTVDGDDPSWINGYNSLLVYTNITLATLPWQTVPDIQGPAIGLDISGQALGGNEYPGLQFYSGIWANGPNAGQSFNYIYSGTYRDNFAWPCVQIYTNDIGNGNTLAEVWNSVTSIGGVINTGPDLFHITVEGLSHGTVDVAVSPDGKFIVAQSVDNWFVIAYLTNGIPDSSRVFNNIPTSTTGNGRGIAFDAAGNIYSSSSGIGNVQEWSMGITATCVTTGNTNTSTGFSYSNPSTEVSVVATTPNASQGGSNGTVGTPVPGVFTITRSGSTASTLPVTFTLSGTATAGVYTAQSPFAVPTSTTVATTNTVVMAEGQSTTNIIVTPTTANVPRTTTTVFLSLLSGAAYSTTLPFSDTVYIQNTSSNELFVSAYAATMYKAFSNDFASILLTRLGDTNVTYTVPATAFSYAGSTAIQGTDFKAMPAVTVPKGALTETVSVSPLANGALPVDTINPTYAGNKTINVTVAGGANYGVAATANAAVLTLLDNAYPPNPVLFADPLTNSAESANWNITYGNGDQQDYPAAYQVDFGFNLLTANGDPTDLGLIGLPPSGATNALRITCNKNLGSGDNYGGGVNVYYTNQVLSGDYAVRFNMNVVEGDNAYQVEGVMFGINHNGMETNWWLGNGTPINNSGPWAADGVWFWIQTPPGGADGFGFDEYRGIHRRLRAAEHGLD